LIATLGKSFGEPATDLSGRSSDEYFHIQSVATGSSHRLEKTDKRAR
jgi:hypothetical protein